MRNLLFLLFGLGLTCIVGFALFGAPAPAPAPEATHETASPAPAPLAMLSLLVLASWAILLVSQPYLLRFALTLAATAAGTLTLLAGAFSAYWDHYMRPHETAGWWIAGAGVLMLPPHLLAWLRWIGEGHRE